MRTYVRVSLFSALGLLSASAMASLPVSSFLFDQRYSNTASETIDYITNSMEKSGCLNASVALVDSNRIVWLGCFGYENRERGINVSTTTVFRIGSCSKVFTTTAALQLYEQGLIGLTNPVHQYVPEFHVMPRAGYPPSDTITMKQILGYHSGLPGDVMRFAFLDAPFTEYAERLCAYLQTTYALYPPDMANSYCNAGFTLAEMVVARMNTSAVAFTTYCDQAVFTPLGMHSTSFLRDKPGITNNLVVGYIGGAAMPEEYVNAYGTGSMFSTPADLARYLMAVLAGGAGPQGPVLAPATLGVMLEPQGTNLPLNINNLISTGLGWDSVRNPRLDYAGRVCFKTGGTALFSAFIEALPDQQLAAAFIHTSPGMLSWDGTDYLLRRAVRDKAGIPIPSAVTPVPAPVTNAAQPLFDGVAGTYVSDKGIQTFTAAPGSLTWTRNADTAPVVLSNIVLRTNGWFSSATSQNTELQFTNLSGHDVVVQRALSPDATFLHMSIGGERVAPTPPSAAWTNRLDMVWPLLCEHADVYCYSMPGVTYGMTLRMVSNVLVATEFTGENRMVDPVDDSTAFAIGMITRADSALRCYTTNGMPIAQIACNYYQDPRTVPVITTDTTTNGSVTLDYCSMLFAADLASNAACEAMVTSAPENFRLSLMDASCAQLAMTNAGAVLPFIAPAAGRYYLKVQAGVSGVPTGTFTLSFQVPEPAAMMLAVGCLLAVVQRRRHGRYIQHVPVARPTWLR